MKKVGVITFQFANNYGAVLQTYALVETIKQYGVYVEVINFVPTKLASPYALFPDIRSMVSSKGIKYTIRLMLSRAWNIRRVAKRIRGFNRFRHSQLNLTSKKFKTANKLNNLEEKFDFYITGSDQVWNPSFFTKLSTYPYFLDFAPVTTKKISYAASIGEKVDKVYHKIYSDQLNSFDYISVREESAKKFLDRIIGKDIEVTLDPTLLLDRDTWSNIETPKKVKDKYILVYNLVNDPLIIELANKLSTENKYKIISYSKKSQFENWHSSFASLSPNEFLSLFANAELVITNSFHGTAFALVYNKLFYTIPHPVRGSRMIDLLTKLDLKYQIVTKKEDFQNLNKEIDYDKINKELSYLRDKSLAFIEKALGIKNVYNNKP